PRLKPVAHADADAAGPQVPQQHVHARTAQYHVVAGHVLAVRVHHGRKVQSPGRAEAPSRCQHRLNLTAFCRRRLSPLCLLYEETLRTMRRSMCKASDLKEYIAG